MIAYLDASVLLRIVLRETDPLAEWDSIQVGITSELTRVEAARVVDRLTVLGVLQDEEIEEKYAEVTNILKRVDIIPINKHVLSVASRPLPIVLGTLDSVHLASASIYRDARRMTSLRSSWPRTIARWLPRRGHFAFKSSARHDDRRRRTLPQLRRDATWPVLP